MNISAYDSVAAALADITGIPTGRLTADTRLTDLDLDSLLVDEFLTLLATRHGLDLSQSTALGASATIGDVLSLIGPQGLADATQPSGAFQ